MNKEENRFAKLLKEFQKEFFVDIVSVYSNNLIPSSFIKGVIAFIDLRLLEPYEDVKSRQISDWQSTRLKDIIRKTKSEFITLANKHNCQLDTYTEEPLWDQNFYEAGVHILFEAINESQSKKIDVFARFWAHLIFFNKSDWDNIHLITSIISKLTYRQIVLIRIIHDGFLGKKDKQITNSNVCVELNSLLDYGVWSTSGAGLGIDNSAPITLNELEKTSYCDYLYEILMLSELPDEDIKSVIMACEIL